MPYLKKLYGIDQSDIRKNCILMPFLPPQALEQLGVKSLASGKLFSAGSAHDLTVIKTGIGAGMVGDAVLYLKNTPCENIIFLGSCGLIQKRPGFDIGKLVTPVTASPYESFSDIITQQIIQPIFSRTNEDLLTSFIEITQGKIPRVTCVSFASLYLEEENMPVFKKMGFDVIEMECSALFHAAKATGKKAIAILFISDILEDKPFYADMSTADKKSLTDGIGQACKLIKKFCQSA